MARITERVAVVALLLSFLLPCAWAQTRPAETQYLRFIEQDDGGGRLESTIIRYRNAAGVEVDLIAALHVADRAYYRSLSKDFESYDALLYEMVKPQGMDAPPPGVHAGGAVSGLQRLLKTVLQLDFQLDAIDYTAPNFVHADLDAETFHRLQAERGETILTIILQAMLQELMRGGDRGAPPLTMPQLLAALNSPDRARQLKLLLARQFEDIEAMAAGLGGPNGSVIITERNKAAINVLRQTVASGKKSIGIFYGAAHLPDLSDRLDLLGFTAVETRWIVAWDMSSE